MKKGGQNRLSQETFLERAISIHGDVYDYTDVRYNGMHYHVSVGCRLHGIFLVSPTNHLRREGPQGCPECGKQKTRNRNYAKAKSFEKIVEESKAIHGEHTYEYFRIVKNPGDRSRIELECSEHGIFCPTVANHLSHRTGCPKCKNSKGETAIREILSILSIPFLEQHRFDDCRGESKPLVFDFYLPGRHCLIEYQGEQHFKLTAFHGMAREKSEAAFARQQQYDQSKRIFCRDRNIPLIEIDYRELRRLSPAIISDLIENANIRREDP